MDKQQFLNRLAHAMQGLPQKDIEDSIAFYGEMIDDRIESGMSEQEAVAAVGAPESVAREMMVNLPLSTLIKSKCKTKKSSWRVWEIVLLALGSPIWLSLLIGAAAVVLSVFVTLWAVFASLWAVDLTLAGSAAVMLLKFGILLLSHPASALIYLGIGLTSAGAAILAFFGCFKLTRVFVRINIWLTRAVKNLIIGRGKKK